MKLKIKKNDTVKVISGNSAGTVGRVLEVYPEKMRVLVEGVNVRVKHMKPNQQNQQGGKVTVEMPIHYSNVMLVDSDGKTTRVGVRHDVQEKDGKQKRNAIRIAKSNGKDL